MRRGLLLLALVLACCPSSASAAPPIRYPQCVPLPPDPDGAPLHYSFDWKDPADVADYLIQCQLNRRGDEWMYDHCWGGYRPLHCRATFNSVHGRGCVRRYDFVPVAAWQRGDARTGTLYTTMQRCRRRPVGEWTPPGSGTPDPPELGSLDIMRPSLRH
jgi:hypothetical protein